MSKELSEEEIEDAKRFAANELGTLENIFNSDKLSKMINTFINKFVICEQIYKNTYKHVKSNDCNVIRINYVKKFFHALKYDFNDELLKNIFGSEKHRNRSSAKKLRDSIMHDMNSGAIKEITTRYDELIGYMDVFLNGIRSHTEKEKEE